MNAQVNQFGVTLVELLVVITVAAILMSIGIPSYRYVTTANRISGEINGLLGDVQFARYEAIKEGLPVTICPAQTATSVTCDAQNTWSEGWIVLSNANAANASAVLRRQLPFSNFNSNDSLTSGGGVQSLIFNREGFATGLGGIGTVMFSLHDSTSNVGYTRCLMISAAGAAATVASGKTLFTVTCS
jgi:type IV fimbrial biogenesis protein FimT